MPELPEVETLVRDLRPLLVEKSITAIEIYWEGAIATPSPAEFRALLPGKRIEGVARRGKFVILHLHDYDLLIHLRMSGQLLVASRDEDLQLRHLRVALTLDGQRLLFNDMRKFGRMYLVNDIRRVLGNLGPEPLEESFTAEVLSQGLRGRRLPIKSLLLDQRLVAGVGNIYADEALHAAGIAPRRQAGTLSQGEITALHSAICDTLQHAIRHRGTTLSDYRDAWGRRGENRQHLRTYDREGEPCLRCGSEIRRERIGGRSSYYCPRCQT